MPIYAQIINATGWTWNYIRKSMTFPRYSALKREWEKTPPLHVTVFAIACAFGFKPAAEKAEDDPVSASEHEVYYDESYYENTPQTPWHSDAFSALKRDFQEAGGMVK